MPVMDSTVPVLPVLLSTVCLLLLLCYLVFRWQYRHVLATAAKLPCPPALPVLGNALLFFGDILSVTKNILKISTGFKGLSVVWIGPLPIFILNDPADAQIILNNSNTLEKDDLYSLFKAFFGNGLLTAPVCTWKKYRKLINPVLHPSNVENFFPVFNEVGKRLTDELATTPGPLDPTDSIFDCAIDAIMRTVISRKPPLPKTKADVKHILDSIGRIFILRIVKVWLHLDWVFHLLYRREIKEAVEKMNDCMDVVNEGWRDVERIRNECPEEDTERLSGINLVDIVAENMPVISADHDWRDEVTTMIAGGSDTVVGSIALLIFTIGHHPEVQEKILNEILDVMGDLEREVTSADLHAMTYLDQVITENLRLHGNIVGIMRRATKDTKLSDITLPAGSRVAIMLHGMGWDRDLFPDPEQFRPERFSPEKQKERHSYAFVPFSGGPRNCIGKAYALTITKTILVHVLRRLRVTSHTKLSDIEYELKVVMYSKTPLMVTFQHR